MTELPLFDFIPRRKARRGDPVTSVRAAEKIASHVTEHQLRALAVFHAHPVSSFDDFQLAEATGLKQTSVGVRRGELLRMGLIEKTFRRESPSRLTNSIVQAYRITDKGAAFYEAERAKG